ncbi:uncharacterized protein isoform X2 [Rhodnius prolixus]|uniref:uncharacterized protein isoform X2 n=1 Tax=Rhodnius prolixus TaxID=13249 RepID=UPI003D18F26B
MNRAIISKSTNFANLALVLSALYLNLSINSANGSEFFQTGEAVMPAISAGGIWPESLGRFATNYGYGRYYKDRGADLDGYSNRRGFYDDLLSSKNVYDVGKTFGEGYDYGKGSVIGGGYRELDGRNRGHQAAGFSTSYRKDESGDKKTYYDDGLGHHGKITYGAQDTRFRDLGGSSRKGGYYDSNLNRNALGNTGKYGDSYGFRGYASQGAGYTGQGGYGGYRGFRAARIIDHSPVVPLKKGSALYVIPTPKKLYFDTTVKP